jgi:hypothetical protein
VPHGAISSFKEVGEKKHGKMNTLVTPQQQLTAQQQAQQQAQVQRTMGMLTAGIRQFR